MKKLFTMLMVVAIATTTAFSQGGTFAIGVGSDIADQSWQDYRLKPTVGYFISDNMMVGLGFGLTSGSVEQLDQNGNGIDDMVDIGTSAMKLSPFFRLYLGEYFFLNAGISLSSGSSDSQVMNSNNSAYIVEATSTSSTDIDLGAGLSLMWNEKIAIEPSLGMVIGSNEGSSSFNLAMGLGINIRLGME
jgi:hypothetical protein